VKYYRYLIPSSFQGFEPAFRGKAVDPSKIELPENLWKVYHMGERLVRRDWLSIYKRNRPILKEAQYYCYDEESRFCRQVNMGIGGDIDSYTTITKRDLGGRPLRVVLHSGYRDQILYSYDYSYDDAGRISQGTYEDIMFYVQIKFLFSYDKQGELLEIKGIYSSGHEKVVKGIEAQGYALGFLGYRCFPTP